MGSILILFSGLKEREELTCGRKKPNQHDEGKYSKSSQEFALILVSYIMVSWDRYAETDAPTEHADNILDSPHLNPPKPSCQPQELSFRSH